MLLKTTNLIAKAQATEAKEINMASLTRKLLSTMGIEDDKADQILEIHQSVLSEIKTERDELKDKASRADDMQKELNEANEKLEASGSDAFKTKYDDLKKEYDDFKADIEAKAVIASKDKAYRQILKDAGVSEKRIDAVMKLTDLSEVELDGDGLKDADKVKEEIRSEWSDFITSEHSEGAGTNNPPAEEKAQQSTVVIPTIF